MQIFIFFYFWIFKSFKLQAHMYSDQYSHVHVYITLMVAQFVPGKCCTYGMGLIHNFWLDCRSWLCKYTKVLIPSWVQSWDLTFSIYSVAKSSLLIMKVTGTFKNPAHCHGMLIITKLQGLVCLNLTQLHGVAQMQCLVCPNNSSLIECSIGVNSSYAGGVLM